MVRAGEEARVLGRLGYNNSMCSYRARKGTMQMYLDELPDTVVVAIMDYSHRQNVDKGASGETPRAGRYRKVDLTHIRFAL